MGDISANINRYEIKCKCNKCSVRIQDHEPVIQVVQGAVNWFQGNAHSDTYVSVRITSAARCREHNLTVGSNDESQHIRCNAMDIQIFIAGRQVEPRVVYDYFCRTSPDTYGIGDYDTFTHIDTRNKKARW